MRVSAHGTQLHPNAHSFPLLDTHCGVQFCVCALSDLRFICVTAFVAEDFGKQVSIVMNVKTVVRPTNMAAEDGSMAQSDVQDDLNGLDKNRLTENDESIEDHMPQIWVHAMGVLKTIGAESVVNSFLSRCEEERFQQRSQQIVDALVPQVADETLECTVGSEWPAIGGAVCLTTDSTTPAPTFLTFSLSAVGPSFACPASRQMANTLNTDSLSQVSPSTGVHTTVDPKVFDVVTTMRHLGRKVHSAAVGACAGAGENPFARVKDWITDLVLQAAVRDRDDGLASENPEHQVATFSFKLETSVFEVAELPADIGDMLPHLKIDAMRVDDLVLETPRDECFPVKKVTDLFEAEQDISVVHQRQTFPYQADTQNAVAP